MQLLIFDISGSRFDIGYSKCSGSIASFCKAQIDLAQPVQNVRNKVSDKRTIYFIPVLKTAQILPI